MAKRYDPIMCMMVDKPDKAQDANKYVEQAIKWMKEGKGRLEIIAGLNQMGLTPSDVASYYAEASLATGYKAKDESEKYAVIMKNSSGKEQHTQGWDLGSIRNWIKDNEKRGYRVTWKNFDSKTIDKAKDYNALDEAIKTADGATGDKLYADVKAIYNLFSNILLTYTNEQSVQKLANEGTKKCLELAAKVKGVRDEAINTCDAVEVETSKWSFSSGKSKPSGFGNWWFKIGTEEKNFNGSWSNAKAEAIKYAKEKGINRISLMT